MELPDDLSNSNIKLNANQQNGGYKDIALVDIYNGIFIQGDTKTDLAKLQEYFSKGPAVIIGSSGSYNNVEPLMDATNKLKTITDINGFLIVQ